MNNTGFSNKEKIFTKNDEKDIDISFYLPEYCPSAQRIVRTQCTPYITQKSLSDSVLFVQGHVNVQVLYSSDNQNTLKSVSFGEDFSCSFDVPENLTDYADLAVDTKTGVVSCTSKIASGRELNVKMRLYVNVDIYADSIFEGFENDDDNVYTLVQEQNVCSKNIILRDSDRLDFEIEIDSSEPQISEILTYDAHAVVEKCTVKDGEMTTFGYIDFHCIYLPVSEQENEYVQPVRIIKKYPFEIECMEDCINSKSAVVPKIIINQTEAQSSYDSYGENRVISVYCYYNCSYNIYNNETVSVCTDAFSSEFASNPVIKQRTYDTVYNVISQIYQIDEKVHIDTKNFIEICDCFAKIDSCNMESIEGKNVLNVRGTVSVLGKGNNGEFNSVNVPVSSKVSILNSITPVPKEARLEAFVSCYDTDISFKEGESLCHMEIGVNAVILQKNKMDVVTQIIADKDKVLEKNHDEMVICYPHSNKSLWEISKHYACSPEEIKKVNGLEGQNIANAKMIIIP